MAVFSVKQNRFQMSYKKGEVAMYQQIEGELMNELCIPTRCDLHKLALRTLYASRQKSLLQMV